MMSYQNHGFADPWTNLWTNVYYKCRNNWNERCCLGTFFFQVQIIWEIIPEISSSIIPKRNIPESSSEEEKVAAMGNWRSMRMDMISESVKQSQNCLHRGVRELGCLSTYSHPALIFLFFGLTAWHAGSYPESGGLLLRRHPVMTGGRLAWLR